MLRRIALALLLASVSAQVVVAGTTPPSARIESANARPPRCELAVESAYLLGIFGNPHSYEVNANFLTARWRCGDFTDLRGFWRGYNQIYLSAEAQPIIRGIENRYFGINLGLRYNFVRSNWRLVPYISGGLGLGFIDSNADGFGSQGQDFTFNILGSAGLSYRVTSQASVQAGLLYEHFSNAGQTDANPSLNLLGPQVGFTLAF